jgi:hypothetical protein
MRNFKARRMLAALSPVLVAIFLVASMSAGAAQSGLQYAIIQSQYGSIVGQIAGNGLSVTAGGVSVTLKGPVSASVATPNQPLVVTTLPKGTKFTPLYVVITSAGVSSSWLGLHPALKCPAGQLPALNLQKGGPKAVGPTSKNWECIGNPFGGA